MFGFHWVHNLRLDCCALRSLLTTFEPVCRCTYRVIKKYCCGSDLGCRDTLQTLLEELSSQSRSVGMGINMSKAKILTNTQQHRSIKIKDQQIEIIDSIIYSGQTISFRNQDEKEINRRVAIG